MYRLTYVLTLFILLSCKNEKNIQIDSETKDDAEKVDNLQHLFGLMQGSFNSEIQSKSDSTYYNISLHMYPIWEKKGHYLYVEQALNSKQDKPYRQRIYELNQLTDSTFSSAIYTIPNDSLWIGKWKTPEAFNSLSKDSIIKKVGCEVILKQIESNYFKGETSLKTCESTLYGAAYATSEVEIFEDKIISWDRGFDNDDNHIWGAEKGGYIFNKLD